MKLRSEFVTVGAIKTGARALWRATGTTSEEFGCPIIGIAMGHEGMMSSQPSCAPITDACACMTNAYAIDVMNCPSNSNKITPATRMAANRTHLPTIFVSGAGPRHKPPERRHAKQSCIMSLQ
jgi:dihydroxy-acid dehydratase